MRKCEWTLGFTSARSESGSCFSEWDTGLTIPPRETTEPMEMMQFEFFGGYYLATICEIRGCGMESSKYGKCRDCLNYYCHYPGCNMRAVSSFCADHQKPCARPGCDRQAVAAHHFASPETYRCAAHPYRDDRTRAVRTYKLNELRKGEGKEMIYRNHLKNVRGDHVAIMNNVELQIRRYVRNLRPGKRTRKACALKFGCEIGVLRGLVEGLGMGVGETLATLGKTWGITTNQNWRLYDLHDEDQLRECFHHMNLIARVHRRAAAAARRQEEGWWERGF
jgi:hypothetical protein